MFLVHSDRSFTCTLWLPYLGLVFGFSANRDDSDTTITTSTAPAPKKVKLFAGKHYPTFSFAIALALLDWNARRICRWTRCIHLHWARQPRRTFTYSICTKVYYSLHTIPSSSSYTGCKHADDDDADRHLNQASGGPFRINLIKKFASNRVALFAVWAGSLPSRGLFAISNELVCVMWRL